MAKDDKVRMPSSMAGITQYFEEATSNFVLSPKQVVVLMGAVATMVILLHVLA